MGATWRALTPEDCPRWARLLADVELVDDLGEHYDEADLAEELGDPAVDTARDTVGVWVGGELVAYGVVRGYPSADGAYKIVLEGTVAPKHRRQGTGRLLQDWLVARGTALYAERRPGQPGRLESSGSVHNEGQRALLTGDGFAPARWFFTMHRGLADLPAVRVPDGLRLVPYDPGYAEATRVAHNEAFAGNWGFSARSAEDWAHWGVGQRAFRPGVSFLLLAGDAGDAVAGYLLSYEYEADTAATGIREAYVGVLGVGAPWRGRGGGRALLDHAVRAYAEAGYRRAALDVDAANPSGALGLYESAGFAVSRESVRYARPLEVARSGDSSPAPA